MKIFIGIVVLTSALIAIIAFSNQAQVFLLHKMYSLGSGMDDGATELFIRNKHRYKSVVLELLNAETPNTYKAQASFLFGELLLDDPEIHEKIEDISVNHPNKQIRCFWFDVLDGRFEHELIAGSESGKFATYVVKDKGSRCE